MGHQLLARALGSQTYKLKFGHHGVNHPVKDLLTNRILITSQNHGFAVKAQDLKLKDVTLSHVNLNDQTVEGVRVGEDALLQRSISSRGQAGSLPMPPYIFDNFIKGYLR